MSKMKASLFGRITMKTNLAQKLLDALSKAEDEGWYSFSKETRQSVREALEAAKRQHLRPTVEKRKE